MIPKAFFWLVILSLLKVLTCIFSGFYTLAINMQEDAYNLKIREMDWHSRLNTSPGVFKLLSSNCSATTFLCFHDKLVVIFLNIQYITAVELRAYLCFLFLPLSSNVFNPSVNVFSFSTST